MASHNQLGKNAEELACDYLLKNDFLILHKNWRFAHFEIDIIATKNNKVHFVEVKARAGKLDNYPEKAVTMKKFKFLTQAAEAFLAGNPQFTNASFDILAINFVDGKKPLYFFIEDVFL